MDGKEREAGTFPATDRSRARYLVIAYEVPQQRTAAAAWRPILRRRFVTSHGQDLQQLSSRIYRMLPDGPDLTAAPEHRGSE